MDYEIFKVSTDVADAWIIGVQGDYDYVYGGTRKVPLHMGDDAVEEELFFLMHYESHLKNALINRVVEEGVLDKFDGELPKGFMASRIGGGRCLFRPKSKVASEVFSDPAHKDFDPMIRVLFKEVGALLNKQEGRIKLTPDFGKFSGVSDALAEFTPHVLGIKLQNGGCGGKSSYTTSGIIGALEVLGVDSYKEKPITIIGSDGALGVDIVNYFFDGPYKDIQLCDVAYKGQNIEISGKPVEPLPAEFGRFSDACLERGGLVVAVTVGNELENSNWRLLPENTLFVLAHNLALPNGEKGKTLAREIHARGVTLVPGQVLTLGGALTSRLEWFSRQNNTQNFNKPLAHKVVREVVSFLVGKIGVGEEATLYERMGSYADFEL